MSKLKDALKHIHSHAPLEHKHKIPAGHVIIDREVYIVLAKYKGYFKTSTIVERIINEMEED